MTCATPSQTIGPYFKVGLAWLCADDLDMPDTLGQRITIRGRVLDAWGEGVPDALLEFWQADAEGHYWSSEGDPAPARKSFTGFRRVFSDDGGSFSLKTIKPGRVSDPVCGQQAPHINIAVFMRGLLRHLVTRIYFAEESANENDPVLALVPVERRHTLLAKPTGQPDYALDWSVVLGGEQETVFFDW